MRRHYATQRKRTLNEFIGGERRRESFSVINHARLYHSLSSQYERQQVTMHARVNKGGEEGRGGERRGKGQGTFASHRRVMIFRAHYRRE